VPRLLAFGRRLGKERFFIVGSLWRVRCKPLGVVSCWVSGVVAFVALYRPSLAFLLCDQYTSQGVFSKKKTLILGIYGAFMKKEEDLST
jgi:hypothetical protein